MAVGSAASDRRRPSLWLPGWPLVFGVLVEGEGAMRSSRRRRARGGGRSRAGTAGRWTFRWGSGTYMCVEDCDVLQTTEVRPQWSGGERSRRSESTSPTSAKAPAGGTGQVGRAQRLRGPGTCRAVGAGGVGGWPGVLQGLGVPGAIRPVAAQRTAPTEGLRSRGGHGWGSMRDCGGNRKDLVGIGVESLTWAVYASALRALCVLVRGVSALRTGSGPSEPWRA